VGRVRSDVRSVATDVGDGYTCVVRLDTADPQLATVRNRVERAQVEFDTERVRWLPPEAAEGSGG